MSKRLGMGVALLVAGAGCLPYVMKDDVIGPHGEALIELACATPDQCMAFARQTCHGDFDVATNDFTVSGGKTPSSGDLMLVHCANAPGALSPPAVSVAPDAGR
jgi:hypothetical protein